jgi:DNA polymerase-3 subunit epsilon
MVATAPVFADIAAELWQQLQGCIFVAHNVRFDYGFIRAEFARCGYQLQLPQLCTVVESRRYFPGLASYSLGNLAVHFGIELKQHHRALADAAATAELLLLINERRAVNLSRPEVSELLIP